MKVLVPIKRVMDYKTSIRLKGDRSGVDESNVKMSMNPFDEIALEEALRLKEKNIAQEIIAVSIGKNSCQETLRQALAMGADRALLIQTECMIDPLQIARMLKQIATEESVTLIILGKQAIDSDNNQIGQMLAGILNWPQATFASSVSIQQNKVTVVREIDGGLETIEMTLPAVITTDLRLNEPRYISLPNIVKAKTKPLIIKTATDFGVDTTSRTKLLSVAIPEKKRAQIRVSSAKELIERLINESRILS